MLVPECECNRVPAIFTTGGRSRIRAGIFDRGQSASRRLTHYRELRSFGLHFGYAKDHALSEGAGRPRDTLRGSSKRSSWAGSYEAASPSLASFFAVSAW